MQQLIYWLSGKRTKLLEQKSRVLQSQGYSIKHLQPEPGFTTQFAEKKSPVVIVSDDKHVQSSPILPHLLTDPHFNGVRLVLAVEQENGHLLKKAYFHQFRDIVPLDLTDKLWLKRMTFSLGNQSQNISAMNPRLTLSLRSVTTLPITIVWISESQLCLETNINAPIGAELLLKGPLPRLLQLTELPIKVLKSKTTELNTRNRYRLICQWEVLKSQSRLQEQLIHKLKTSTVNQFCKVYIAATNRELKKQLTTLLSGPNFKVFYPLNIQAWINEPLFICPDFLFIEDRLFKEENSFVFNTLFEKIKQHQQVIIVGNRFDRQILKSLPPGVKITTVKHITDSLPDSLLKRIGRHNPQRTHYHLPENHDLSLGEIPLTGVLSTIDQFSAKIFLPYEISNYAFCRIQSDFLKKSVKTSLWAKINQTTNQVQDFENPHPYQIECLFSNNTQKNRQQIGQSMVSYLKSHINRVNTEISNTLLEPISEVTPVHGTVIEDENIPHENTIQLPISPYLPSERGLSKKRVKPKRKSIDWKAVIRSLIFFGVFIAFWYILFFISQHLENSGSIFSRNLEGFRSPETINSE